ncbi:hypothetical protein [Novosphingobium sp.]|uniref:hypothetical protein n=1 Tax=Novosphingobium sp. TaxID=1874826 RepID=UPI0031D0762F
MSLIGDALDAVAPAAAVPAKAAKWLFSDLWRLAFTAVLMVAAVQTIRIGGLILRPELGPIRWTLIDLQGWQPRALAAEKALADLQAQIKAAQPKAAAAQAAVNHQPAARSAAIAKASDHDAQPYYEKVRAARDAYAAAHPAGGVLRASEAAGGRPGHADLPGTDRAASIHDGPGGPADMVAVSKLDFDKLTNAAGRLAKVHQDAQALIDAGVAVSDTGQPAKKD